MMDLSTKGACPEADTSLAEALRGATLPKALSRPMRPTRARRVALLGGGGLARFYG